jgi:anti-sigma factor RsiW
MTCSYSHLDGSYVLGALGPAERQEFERHLAQCPSCARAVRELAGLPGLLGRVDVETVQHPTSAEPVPETLLPTLVREVRRSQRRRVLVTSGLAAAAAVVVAIGAVAAAANLGDDPDRVAAGPTPSATASVGAARDMVPVSYARMAADLALVSVPWGTRLDLSCSYASPMPGDDLSRVRYSLVVHTRDGGSEQVASWRAMPGRMMTLTAATAADRGDITSVEVRAADGRPVLRLTT